MHSSRPDKQDNSRRRGFTLIELLVALAILGSLMAVVYSGLSVALTMWESTGRRTESFEQMQTAVGLLRNQMRGALPLIYVEGPAVEGQPVRPRTAFEGAERGLRFVSAASWRYGPHGPPQWISWRNDEGGFSIDERRVLSPSNTAEPSAGWNSRLDFVEDVSFRYLARAMPNRAAEWRASWNTAELDELPAAVEVRFAYRGETTTMTVPLDFAAANWRGYRLQ